jgi:Sugar phosphate permease
MSAGFSLTLFEMGGLVGSLFAGWFSDRYTMGRRGPVNVIFSAALCGATLFFWMVPAGYTFLDYLSVFVIGFFVFGPQMLIGLAAAELAHKKAAATATGFVGLISYAGAALSGYPLGKIADAGWDGFFIAASVCGVMATLLLLPTWNVSSRKESEDLQTEVA